MRKELALLAVAMLAMWLTAVVAVYGGPFPFMIASILWVGGALVPAIIIFGILTQMIFRWFPVGRKLRSE